MENASISVAFGYGMSLLTSKVAQEWSESGKVFVPLYGDT